MPAPRIIKHVQKSLYYMEWITNKFFIVFTLVVLLFILFRNGFGYVEVDMGPHGGRLKSEGHVLVKRATGRNRSSEWLPVLNTPSNFQLVIQTTGKKGENILTRDRLLMHVNLMLALATFKVYEFSRNWTLADICAKPEKVLKLKGPFADFTGQTIYTTPCVFITPLDCFWEGSKPQGPFPPHDEILGVSISWKSLNPQKVLQTLTSGPFSSFFNESDLKNAEEAMNKSGIGSAYQKRSCIDPLDAECPKTSNNYIEFCSVLKKFLTWNERNKDVYKLPPVNLTQNVTKGSSLDLLANDNYDHAYDTDTEKAVDVCQNKPLIDAVKLILRKNVTLAQKFVPGMWNEGDYGRRLTGGCSGYAANYMKWPEQLVVGRVTHYPNGTIKRAEVLQTIIKLFNHTDLYHWHLDDGNLKGWSPQAADKVIKSWQQKCNEIVSEWPKVVHTAAATNPEEIVQEMNKTLST